MRPDRPGVVHVISNRKVRKCKTLTAYHMENSLLEAFTLYSSFLPSLIPGSGVTGTTKCGHPDQIKSGHTYILASSPGSQEGGRRKKSESLGTRLTYTYTLQVLKI